MMIQQNNPDNAQMYRCTVIRQPFADAFIKAVRTDAEGMTFAEKSIDIHSYPTEYRGDVLICSSSKGVGDANRDGVTIGVVELYDVRPVETFTDKEWAQTRVSRENWRKEKKWFGWFYRNPRPVVELPIEIKPGALWWMAAPPDSIIEYPRAVKLDDAAWRQIMDNNKDKLL
jgi:hypothetical protein